MFKLRKEQTVTGSPVRETLRLAKLSRELSQLSIYCISIYFSIYLSICLLCASEAPGDVRVYFKNRIFKIFFKIIITLKNIGLSRPKTIRIFHAHPIYNDEGRNSSFSADDIPKG
jgi:hypothetical protein